LFSVVFDDDPRLEAQPLYVPGLAMSDGRQIAACGTILNGRANLHFLRLAEHLNATNSAMLDLLQRVTPADTVKWGGDAVHGHAAALKQLWALTWREAQTQTYAEAFLAMAACFVVATAMVPLMRKVVPPKGPTADAH
jgi:DHA2 family multidrug resistance protein